MKPITLDFFQHPAKNGQAADSVAAGSIRYLQRVAPEVREAAKMILNDHWQIDLPYAPSGQARGPQKRKKK